MAIKSPSQSCLAQQLVILPLGAGLTAALWLAAHTPLRLGRTTSEIITPSIAAEDGISVEEAFACRHENRECWFRKGNELRDPDAAYLMRECLWDGEIVVGLRNADKVEAARAEGLIDIFIWIRRDVHFDPTKHVEDLRKAAWYLSRKTQKLDGVIIPPG